MNNNISIKASVDSALLDKAEQEIYQILYQQRLRHNERWLSFIMLKKASSILRLLGLIASIAGVLVGVFYIVYPSKCPRWIFAELFLVFSFCASLFFYYIPRIEAWYFSWLKKVGVGSCKRMARRFVSKGRKLVPYEVEYDIRGNLVTVYRGKENNWKPARSTRLKGFAIMGKAVTLVFRKPNSIVHKLMVLHENSDALEVVLQEQKIPYRKVD
ncbi:MAG: hypothetical protein QNL62_10730 [Gammaproteobacteria bacterium]|nr:hypothetical protein [Gammaproteobacteria bacterium]